MRIFLMALLSLCFCFSIHSEVQGDPLDIFWGNGGNNIDDLQSQIENDNKIFMNICQNFQLPADVSRYNSHNSALDGKFLDQIRQNYFYFPWLSFTSEDQISLRNEITIDVNKKGKKQQEEFKKYEQTYSQRINILKKINPNEGGINAWTRYANSLEQKRKSAYRIWFLNYRDNKLNPNVRTDEDGNYMANFDPFPPNSRTEFFDETVAQDRAAYELIKKYFLKWDDIPEEDKECAKKIKDFMDDLGISCFYEQEHFERPWYIVGCFFEFACVNNRVNKDDLRKDFLRFFPESPDELFNRSQLKDDGYSKMVEEAIREWLREKFAYPEKEMEGKNLGQLLILLKEQFVAVRPYHRWLAKQYRDRNDEKTANFIERFMFK